MKCSYALKSSWMYKDVVLKKYCQTKKLNPFVKKGQLQDLTRKPEVYRKYGITSKHLVTKELFEYISSNIYSPIKFYIF